jgi:hypothetical protein
MDEPTSRTELPISARALEVIRQGHDPGQVISYEGGRWEHPPLGDFASVAAYYELLLARRQ